MKQRNINGRHPMSPMLKNGFRIYCIFVLVVSSLGSLAITAFATNDPLTVVNNLSEFIFGLIRAIGLILLGWGIVQVGLSLQSHDPSQRSNGFLTLAGPFPTLVQPRSRKVQFPKYYYICLWIFCLPR